MKVRSLIPFCIVLSLFSPTARAASPSAASKGWGATAYASSFSKVEDPRKLLEGGGSWSPLADDTNPRLDLIWPGEVLIESIVLKGELDEATITLHAGGSRYSLSPAQTRVERSAGKVAIVLVPPRPIRVAEIALGSAQVKVDAVEVFISEATPDEARPFVSGELTLSAGAIANLTFPGAPAATLVEGPWLYEAEFTASTPFRATQDYRAIRALSLTPDAVHFTVSPWATDGEYSLFRSQLGNPRRELLGSLMIKGTSQWDASKGDAEYSGAQMETGGHLLPHLQCGDEQIPFVVFALAAPSFEKLAAYSATGARLWKINTTQSPLLATPDISANVAQCVREIDVNIRQMLALAPQSRIFIAPDLRPRKGWLESYPEEVFRASDGRGGEGANFGSEVLNRDIRQALCELVTELRKTPYASRIVGILPYFGRGGDGWGYGVDLTIGVPREKVVLGDRSPAEEKAFTRWLEARYGAPLAETLPRHWPEQAVERPLHVPPDAALAGEGNGLLLDPVSQRDVIDYWSYRANSVSSAIVGAGEAVKAASGGKLLYGAHYGYVMSARNLAPAFSQLGGHFDLARLLHSDAVDLINGGSSGDKRGATGNYEPLTPIGSVLLHEKLPVVELDNRSPFTRGVPPYEYYQLYSIAEWIDAARRDVGFAMTHNAGLWWYDMSMPHEANPYNREPWFIEEGFLSLVKETVRQAREPARESGMAAPVAVFMDEEVIPYQDVYATFIYENLNRALIESLSAAGAGFRCYLLSDHARWSRTKEAAGVRLEVLLNPWLEPRDGWISLASSPRAQLWMAGAALASRDERYETPQSEPLIGVSLKAGKMLSVPDSRLEMASELSPPLEGTSRYALKPFSGFHRSQAALFGETIAPYYLPMAQEHSTVLARFRNGEPGLLLQTPPGKPQRFFSTLPYLPANVLRQLYAQSGVKPLVPYGAWYVSQGRSLTVINLRHSVKDHDWVWSLGTPLFEASENAGSWILRRDR